MKRQLAVFLCSTVLGFVTFPSHAIAQQKTVWGVPRRVERPPIKPME
jgi:hypothetical protein